VVIRREGGLAGAESLTKIKDSGAQGRGLTGTGGGTVDHDGEEITGGDLALVEI